MPSQIYPIRFLDIHRDLDAVADLIEVCFREHLDQDGYQYIFELRRAARQRTFIDFIPGSGERISMPIFGYVCEIGNKVVGNLSLIPFLFRTKWIYLIANVAVHPDYQGRGIGKQLTQKALQHTRDHRVSAVWLQVRDDNPVAIHLYESLGFIERARRTNWLSQDHTLKNPHAAKDIIVRQRTNHFLTWELQQKWLSDTYPPEIAWYFPFHIDSFKASFWREVWNTLTGTGKEHWSAYQGDHLIGTASWEPTRRSADNVWLAAASENENTAISSLLPYLSYQINNRRRLLVNYPAGRAEDAFTGIGYKKHNTLIWMKVDFET